MKLNLVWRPRSQNVEADSLTNQKFEGFDLDKRVQVCWEDLPFQMLHELLGTLKDYQESLDSEKAKGTEGVKSHRYVSAKSGIRSAKRLKLGTEAKSW